MKLFINKIRQLWKDESAQGATEYILLLVVVVALAFIFREKITEVIRSKVADVGSQIEGFTGGN